MKRILRWVAVLGAVGCAAGPAVAMYKVVGPDGKVTYTDRPPTQNDGKAVPLGGAGGVVSGAALPFVLQGPTSRYPVTLYTVPDCAPCDRARALLRQRGVPHTERIARTEADYEAWQRQLGSRQAPQMTLGTQKVEGLDESAWQGYLDAAGYPAQSALPRGYSFAPAQPLAPQAAPAPRTPASPQVVPAADTAPPKPGSFRF